MDRRFAGPIIGAAIASLAVTLGVALLPFARFAYRYPSLHVVFETAEALIAFLTALLVFGRFRLSRRASDLVLVYVLILLGSTNLFFTLFDAVFSLSRSDTFLIWAPSIARLVGSIVLVGAAFGFKRTLTQPARGLPVVLAAIGTFVIIAGAVYSIHSYLPDPIRSISIEADATRIQIEGHFALYLPQAMMTVFFGLAAVGFGTQAIRRRDELMRWLSGGSVLSAFASINFLLFPSIYTDFVYAGDLLRLGFYLMLLVGAGREIRSYWQSLASAAIADERRRLARDLHDGIGQELILISAHIHRLLKHGANADDFQRLSRSTERAVAESRRAIAALSSSDESLSDALRELAEETSRRFGILVQSELDEVDVDGHLKEEVLRIAREGVMNAIRHANPKIIRVYLIYGELITLGIADDGRGFDVDDPAPGGYGLQNASEKARALGGDLVVRSAPGGGTELVLKFESTSA